jgi:hypothetical protein
VPFKDHRVIGAGTIGGKPTEDAPSSFVLCALHLYNRCPAWVPGAQRYAKCRAVFNLKYRVVWCPKYRRPVLPSAIETRLFELMFQSAHCAA